MYLYWRSHSDKNWSQTHFFFNVELINNSDLLPVSSKLLDDETGMNPDNEAALLNMSHCCRREAPEILVSSVITQLQEMASSSLLHKVRDSLIHIHKAAKFPIFPMSQNKSWITQELNELDLFGFCKFILA